MADTIGPYRVVNRLGAGGMGEVFLAEDPRLGRLVAVKRVSNEWLESHGSADRLRREARAVGQLNHPNIAAVYDVLDVDGRPHLVMEYVPGETLAAALGRGPLPVSQVIDIGVQIADALIEAHEHHIVHRDLKPANVVVTPSGRAKVLDFGLARMATSGSATTAVSDRGLVIGTPGYMPPEQLLGLPVDERSDIYSAGIVIYELLTGRGPFDRPDAVGRALATLQEREGPRPDAVNPAVPAALAAVVSRALAREPSDRYQTALEWREALVGARGTEAPLLDNRQRRRYTAVSAAVVVAAIAITSAIWFWPRGAARGPGGAPVVAVLPFENLTGDAANDSLAIGFADSLITDLATVADINVVRRDELREFAKKRAPKTVGAQLGATVIVDAALLRSGNALKVNVRLFGADAAHIWSQEYQGTTDVLFDLQRRIADGVIAGGGLSQLARSAPTPRSSDVAALVSYGQGRAWLDRADVPGNVEKAMEAFSSATTRDPQFALAHAALGEAALRRYATTKDRQWVDLALRETDEAVKIDPGLADVYVSRGLAYKQTGKLPEAIAAFEKAISLQRNHDNAYGALGDALIEANRTEEGLARLREAIRLRPIATHYDQLGTAFLKLGRSDDAIEPLLSFATLQPDNAGAHHKLGTAYQMKEDWANALKHYNEAIRIRPLSQTYANMGLIQYNQQDNAGAVRSFSTAVQMKPNEPQLHRNLGDAYLRVNERDKARAEYEKSLALLDEALQVNPASALLKGQRAVLLAKIGRHTEAIRAAADPVIVNSQLGDVLYRRAVVFALAGRDREGLDALSAAVAHGYSLKSAAKDDDLARLRALPEWSQIKPKRN